MNILKSLNFTYKINSQHITFISSYSVLVSPVQLHKIVLKEFKMLTCQLSATT